VLATPNKTSVSPIGLQIQINPDADRARRFFESVETIAREAKSTDDRRVRALAFQVLRRQFIEAPAEAM